MTVAQTPKARGEDAASTTPPLDWSRDLVAAADAGDEIAFAGAVPGVDWTERTEDDFEAAVRLALAAGAHGAGRALSAQGFAAFPESAILQKMATILSPPRVVRVGLPADPSVAANQQWMRAHWEKYRGCWVALRDGNLLAAAPTLREVEQQVGEIRNSGLFVTRIAG